VREKVNLNNLTDKTKEEIKRKKEVVLAIIIWIMILIFLVGILSLAFPKSNFGISKYQSNLQKGNDLCTKILNGTWKVSLEGAFKGQCIGIDEDEYRFYWYKAKDGTFYKTKD